MGVDLSWQDENGRQLQFVVDPDEAFSNLLESDLINGTSFLRYVDPYGDTVFNQNQIPELFAELAGIIKGRETQAKLQVYLKVIESSIGKVHTYIKFIGD